jgi:hypothetical protein
MEEYLMNSYWFDLVQYKENGAPYFVDSIEAQGNTYTEAIAHAITVVNNMEGSASMGIIILLGEK